MTDKTVQNLAQNTGIPVNKLLEKIKEAGLPQYQAGDIISTREQDLLVSYLTRNYVINESKASITPKRKINNPTISSPSIVRRQPKTINVEVRKKHTFSKPDPEQIKLEALQRHKNNNFDNFINFIRIHGADISKKDIEKRISFDEKSNIK